MKRNNSLKKPSKKAYCVGVIVRKNQATKETLPIPPRGMKCGHCVSHLLSLLLMITLSEEKNEIKRCFRPYKTSPNIYTTLWSEGE